MAMSLEIFRKRFKTLLLPITEDTQMKKERTRVHAMLLLTAVVLVTAGCQKRETLGTVSGNVTFQGKPVTQGVVMFRDAGRGIYITAELDAQGHYEVKQATGAGLQPGEYQVSVNPPVVDAPMGGPAQTSTFPNIPLKYRDANTSGLTLTVPAEGTTMNIDMKP